MWKICTKCGKHKALWAFCKHNQCEFSLRGECLLCKKILDIINNRKNRKKVRNRNTDYYHRNRNKISIKGRKYTQSNAKFIRFGNKFTVDEAARLAKDGISIEVKCRHCRKYFTPSTSQARARMTALNTLDKGWGECNLYCSDECKSNCTLFKRSAIVPNKPSLREKIPQELRNEVLQRNDGMCEMCGEHPSEEIHHEKPVSTHPHLQLDKENLWGLCEHCHYEVCHQIEGCTLPELKRKSINNCKI